MNTTPHAHFCPICRRRVDCVTARRGGCSFQQSTEISCDPCVARKFGGDPEAYEHLCQCAAPAPDDSPSPSTCCDTCGRFVGNDYPEDRVLNLETLGKETR